MPGPVLLLLLRVVGIVCGAVLGRGRLPLIVRELPVLRLKSSFAEAAYPSIEWCLLLLLLVLVNWKALRRERMDGSVEVDTDLVGIPLELAAGGGLLPVEGRLLLWLAIIAIAGVMERSSYHLAITLDIHLVLHGSALRDYKIDSRPCLSGGAPRYDKLCPRCGIASSSGMLHLPCCVICAA